MSDPTPEVKIILPGVPVVDVEFFVGVQGPEHFRLWDGAQNAVIVAAGWLAFEDGFLTYPHRSGEVSSAPSRLGVEEQAIIYISGIDPEEIGIECASSSAAIDRTSGSFPRLTSETADGTAGRRIDYTDRHEVTGLPNCARLLVYSALTPIHTNPFTGRRLHI